MFSLEGFAIPGVSITDGAIAMPHWLAGGLLALLVLFFILMLVRARLGALIFLALIALGGVAVWAWLDRDRLDERRALEQRLTALSAQAHGAGSNLACLDAPPAETLASGCEAALFAAPETVAAALSYTTARLALLADGVRYATRRDPDFEPALEDLRRALAQDRFATVAQVLATQKGCTAERCEPLALLRDPARVRANLRERAFETLLSRHAPNWAARARNGASPAPAAGTPLPPNYSLPSASSIPPVSIMSNEPMAQQPAAPQAAPAESAPAAAAPRRPAAPQRPPQARAPTNPPPAQILPRP